jgi:hypothetical protein
MTQPGDEPTRPDEGQGTEQDSERDVRRAGGGRTAGETSVDDDLGRGD